VPQKSADLKKRFKSKRACINRSRTGTDITVTWLF